MKGLLRSKPVQVVVAWLAAQYIRLVFATSTWTMIGAEHAARLQAAGKPLIGCFWHGRMLMMPKIWTYPAPMHMLISNHADGRLIARVIAHLGIRTIVGSSSRGGAAALRAMTQALARGGCVSVTPDGPRGPRMRAAPGVVMAAKLSGAAIVPVSYSSSRALTLSSWDRFLVALPFGRGVFIWGEPVEVAADADAAAIEAARATIEARLNQLTDEADRMCGRTPTAPAPARISTAA
ncbi:MAG TPA: lysophospholipid acyltransferase family protein [Alphaproteobacteria bacterium]